MPKISVILPGYNVETYLRECIDSAIHQTLEDIEIICVNDGSTDHTLDIMNEYAAKDARVKVIDKPNSGYGHSMNCGMDAATGEYIAILETDDYLDSNMFAVLYQVATENRLDLVKADYEIFLGEGADRSFEYQTTCRKKDQYYRTICPSEEPDVFNARMNTWTGIYNREFLYKNHIRHNETPGASYQDNGFWFQTFLFAERIMFVNRAFYKLRRDNPNSSVHNKGKVFCIFEEYSFIENIVRSHPDKEKQFISMFHKKKFDNCLYHYKRVGYEFKMEFLNRFSEEFREARDKGELQEDLFVGSGWSTISMIMDNPELYYANTVIVDQDAMTKDQEIAHLKVLLEAREQELNQVKNSKAFRVATALALLPRALRKVKKSIHDNGVSGTVKKGLKKLAKDILSR